LMISKERLDRWKEGAIVDTIMMVEGMEETGVNMKIQESHS